MEHSHRSLGVVNDKLEVMSAANHLAGEIGEDSQFEGITYRSYSHTAMLQFSVKIVFSCKLQRTSV